MIFRHFGIMPVFKTAALWSNRLLRAFLYGAPYPIFGLSPWRLSACGLAAVRAPPAVRLNPVDANRAE